VRWAPIISIGISEEQPLQTHRKRLFGRFDAKVGRVCLALAFLGNEGGLDGVEELLAEQYKNPSWLWVSIVCISTAYLGLYCSSFAMRMGTAAVNSAGASSAACATSAQFCRRLSRRTELVGRAMKLAVVEGDGQKDLELHSAH
jgi:hypothetical protein